MIAIANLRKLISNDNITAKLKESKKYTEFAEQVRDIIDTYDRKLDHIPFSIKEIHKLTTAPMVEAKLKELGKWGEKTARIDSSWPWEKIINIVKYYTNTQEAIDEIETFSSSILIQNTSNISQNKSFSSSPLKKIYNFGANNFREIKSNTEPTYENIKESVKLVADKVYDFGAKSFHIIKNTSSILSSKVTKTLNFVNNKVLPYLSVGTLSEDKLIKKIINTPEKKLDKVFEKMTYEKLAELINNASNEKAQELVNYILPKHFEKIVGLISDEKLSKLFNENANNLSLDELTEQELKKLSDENISDEQLENIVILAGEEKLAEKLDIIPNENLERIIDGISNDKLAIMINNASDENLERIVDSISNEKLAIMINNVSDENLERVVDIIDSGDNNLSIPLVQQTIALIYNKECIKQEVEEHNSELSDNDSGFDSDFEDETEVSGNQQYNDFTTKVLGSECYGFSNCNDDIVYV